MKYIVSDINQYYKNFGYPSEFIACVDTGELDWGEWYVLPEQRAKQRLLGLMERYPNRKLVPFARRDDRDDIACFDVDKVGAIEIIHDYSSPGYEQRKEYEAFNQWVLDISMQ